MSEQKERGEEKKRHESARFASFMKKVRADNKKKQSERAKKDKREGGPVFSNFHTFFQKIFNKLNMWIDAMLATNFRIACLSLLMALIIAYFVSGGNGISTTKSIDYIDGVPVEAITAEGMEANSYDQEVTLQLIGDYSSIQWNKVMKNYQVVLDVRDLEEGTHEVFYRVEGVGSGLEVKTLPESTTVNISRVETRSFDLSYEWVRQNEMDSAYILQNAQLHQNAVEITAGGYRLDQIDHVSAQIDVADVNGPVYDGEAPVVAYNEKGDVMDVPINPLTVGYDLEVVSYFKSLPITIDVQGEVAEGCYLSGVTASTASVTVYAQSQADLDAMSEVHAYVDVGGLDESKTIDNVVLVGPKNALKLSLKQISVEVIIDKQNERTFRNIPILFSNLRDGYTAKFVGGNTCDLVISGPSSLLKAINPDKLKIYVDLKDATEGTNDYALVVSDKQESLEYRFVNGDTIAITISRGS